MVKSLPASKRRRFILGLRRALEKETATHFSILDWEVPQTEPGEPQSTGRLTAVRHNLVTEQQTANTKKYRKLTNTYCGNFMYLPASFSCGLWVSNFKKI